MAEDVEVPAHAARRYVDNLDQGEAVVNQNFRNAFNTLRRDSILEAIHATLPEVYSYEYASYASSSRLSFADNIMSSDEGIQQGDPIGPLLFCLTLHPVLFRCRWELWIAQPDRWVRTMRLGSLR